ncbi:hypothetical protein LTR48_007049 [Friedmanniomyces endolithicus]|uniref:Major facilitator superfamily (MFS) profile domain-containing protein n=1 Tax=Rachicladosporium monterosium TaxID=1507873 RepID=A0ABR0KX73_9PEZI|nr:hypothetical protein LTR48_007049 [Friedmanniomyces endolithicus]KAK5140049.1 hypothetical protein LTR32_007039 [Rachicladosporium monterosium]
MERYGRKKTFGACVILTAAFIFIQFFARTLPVLLVGELLGGLVLGTYATIAPTYASEASPIALRGVLTSYINLSFVMGQLIANGVIAGTSQLSDHWAYSGPFASQWIWCLVILVGWPFAPESPWFLIRKGRFDEAENALRRLASKKVDVKPAMAMMIETDRLEQELEAGTTYFDCFQKINRRRTEIAMGVYSIQVISGIYLVGYATYFFTLAGLPTDKAFDMSIGFLALGFVGTLCSWVLLQKFGRRTIYNTGLAALVVLLLVIGILDCVPGYTENAPLIWAQSSLMLVWNFCYGLSVGPVCFVILCEVSATKVRSKTIAVATATQALVGIVMTIAIPYLINPDQANARGKIGFFFGGLSALSLVWSFLRVPETKGRTYEELDIMFSRNVATRHFKEYHVE